MHISVENSSKLSGFQLPYGRRQDAVYKQVYIWVLLKSYTDYSMQFIDWKSSGSFQIF